MRRLFDVDIDEEAGDWPRIVRVCRDLHELRFRGYDEAVDMGGDVDDGELCGGVTIAVIGLCCLLVVSIWLCLLPLLMRTCL